MPCVKGFGDRNAVMTVLECSLLQYVLYRTVPSNRFNIDIDRTFGVVLECGGT
jgi:hypothetical protein